MRTKTKTNQGQLTLVFPARLTPTRYICSFAQVLIGSFLRHLGWTQVAKVALNLIMKARLRHSFYYENNRLQLAFICDVYLIQKLFTQDSLSLPVEIRRMEKNSNAGHFQTCGLTAQVISFHSYTNKINVQSYAPSLVFWMRFGKATRKWTIVIGFSTCTLVANFLYGFLLMLVTFWRRSLELRDLKRLNVVL